MTAQDDPASGQPFLPAEIHTMHAALAALHRGAAPQALATAGASLIETPSMTLSLATQLPPSAIVLNHGFAAPPDFADAVDAYRRAGVARFFLSTLAPVDPALLERTQMRPARGRRLFRRDASAAPPDLPQNGVRVAQRGAGDAGAFARIVSDAFDLGEAAQPWMAGLPNAPGWHVFQGEIDGQPVGTGALYVADGIGWTDFGSTHPAHRGKGVQKTLLAHRVRHAQALGCHTLLTCTGEAVPGEDQISYHNILGAGFRESSLMHNHAPAPVA